MTISEELEQQVEQRFRTSIKRKIRRSFLGAISILLTGAAGALFTTYSLQEKNPYAETPEVRTYDWAHRSLMQIQTILRPNSSSLLTDPPVPDASLSALVEQHNAQFNAPHLSLQQTATSLNKRLEELATLQPVMDYRAFEANREKNLIPLMIASIGTMLLSCVYLVSSSNCILNPNPSYRARLEQQIRETLTQPDIS